MSLQFISVKSCDRGIYCTVRGSARNRRQGGRQVSNLRPSALGLELEWTETVTGDVEREEPPVGSSCSSATVVTAKAQGLGVTGTVRCILCSHLSLTSSYGSILSSRSGLVRLVS
ncbi:hypothetical protein J6590_008598 [Homalodisca vitripennis]|nr:hypothetical protein J6590_008598 [Homalodisca vitripennis]